MKIKLLVVFAFLLSGLVFGSAFIELFQARSDNGNVVLEWKTGNESAVREFRIERRTVDTDFTLVASISAKGSNSFYTFVDENIFKTSDIIFVYRIRIVGTDGSSEYSKEVNVSHSVSGIKRTWGSIKAMFR